MGKLTRTLLRNPAFLSYQYLWMGHVFGFDEGVEVFGADQAEVEGGFAQGAVAVVGGFGDFGGVVVADFGRERGDQHQRVVNVVADLGAIDFDAGDAVIDEAVAGVGEKFDGLQIVEDHHRLENVELEISLRAGEADRGVVAHHLHGDHRDRFALRRIHFARHDRRAGLVFGKHQFAQAAARAGREPANVVGDFHQRGRERFQRAAGENDFVVRREAGEFIRMRAERQPGEVGDFLRGAFGKFGMRVEAGADSGAADRQIVEPVERDRRCARRRDRAARPSRKIPGRR